MARDGSGSGMPDTYQNGVSDGLNESKKRIAELESHLQELEEWHSTVVKAYKTKLGERDALIREVVKFNDKRPGVFMGTNDWPKIKDWLVKAKEVLGE